MFKEKLLCFLQYCLPQHFLSRIAAKIANCEIPSVKNWLIKNFIKHYQVDISEVDAFDLDNYPNFNSFFTRALRKGARPIVSGNHTIASPADGCISQLGDVNKGKILQAKGKNFSVQDLLADEKEATSFEAGSFITLYLAPKDYHRVHMPFNGTLEKMIYCPGELFSVNPCSASHISNLFSRNERVICIFRTAIGPMAVILVGAMLVASIETVWAGGKITPRKKQIQSWTYSDKTVSLHKGDELGRFQFGSTVILLFGPECVAWNTHLSPLQEVKMGQLLGQISCH